MPLVKVVSLFSVGVKLASLHQDRELARASRSRKSYRTTSYSVQVSIEHTWLTLTAKQNQPICNWLEEWDDNCLSSIVSDCQYVNGDKSDLPLKIDRVA